MNFTEARNFIVTYLGGSLISKQFYSGLWIYEYAIMGSKIVLNKQSLSEYFLEMQNHSTRKSVIYKTNGYESNQNIIRWNVYTDDETARNHELVTQLYNVEDLVYFI